MSDLCPRVLLKNRKPKPEVMPLGVKQESVSPILKEQLNHKHKDLLFTRGDKHLGILRHRI